MNSKHNYPRILLLGGEPMSLMTATGITLRNLFSDYPPEKIATAYTTVFPPDWSCSGSHFKLSTQNVLGFDRGNCGIRSAPTAAPVAEGQGYTGKAVKKSWRQFGRKVALECLELLPLTETAEWHSWLDDFAPEVIYTLGAQTQLLRLSETISRRRNIPVVVHFMDNWIETRYAGSLHWISRTALLNALRRTLKRSSLLLAISPEMAEAYERQFGVPGYAFMNSIPQQPYCPPEPDGGERLNLYYIGGLHLKRSETIQKVAAVIEQIPDWRKRFLITVFAPERDWLQADILREKQSVVYGGNLPYSAVNRTAGRADILLHVESFAPECTDYTRLSISTKLVEYFMVGRPVLGVAPDYLASIREIARAGNFVAATEEQILEALTQLSAPEVRLRCGQAAYHYAVQTHASKNVHRRLEEVLRLAVMNFSGMSTRAASEEKNGGL